MNNPYINDLKSPGIVAPNLARLMLTEGWRAADLHVHTLHSYDVIPTRQVDPLFLYDKALRLGMTYVAFTDHDTMAAYDRIGWTRDGLVPAVEVKILDKRNVGHTIHVNIYTLDRRQFREIEDVAGRVRDITELTSYLKAEGLPFSFNHPFWHEPEEKPDLTVIMDIARLFPVLEYNMGRVGRLNAQALRLADDLSKGVVAGTDSHVGEIGGAFTLAQGDSFKEFFAHVAARESRICPADLTLSRLKEETALRINQLFDKKAWLCDKDSLTMETGNALLDGIVRHVARDHAGKPRISSRLLQKSIEALSNSGIPGFLYLNSQNNLAERVGRFLESAERTA